MWPYLAFLPTTVTVEHMEGACEADANCHLRVPLTGDILASINGVNTDGFSHKQIVELIKSAGNYLR